MLQERASGKAMKQSEAEARLQEAEAALAKERTRLDELQVGPVLLLTCKGKLASRFLLAPAS